MDKLQIPRAIDVKKPEDQIVFNSEVVSAFRVLAKNPFVTGVVIDVAVGVTPTRIVHNLGYAPNWLVVDRDADSRVWRVAGSPVIPATYLYLQASSAVNLKVLLF